MKDYITFKDTNGNSFTLAADKFCFLAEPSPLDPKIRFCNVWGVTPSEIPIAAVTFEEAENIKTQLGLE